MPLKIVIDSDVPCRCSKCDGVIEVVFDGYTLYMDPHQCPVPEPKKEVKKGK